MSDERPALLGGTPLRTQPPEAWPIFDEGEREALEGVLESRNWGGFPAPNTQAKAFASDLPAFTTRRTASPPPTARSHSRSRCGPRVSASATRSSSPPLTWVATAAAPLYVGAVPVFADIHPTSYQLDPEAVEAVVTDRTRAIIPVHLGCRMADMDALMQLAARHDLTVIEDCAHMHGATWRGRGAGSIGHLGSFSFQTSKLMTAGEGGMILTSDATLAERCHALANCGRKEPGYDSFEGAPIGWNDRMTEWQAGVLGAQLTRLMDQTLLRQRNTDRLETLLEDIAGHRAARTRRTPDANRRLPGHLALRRQRLRRAASCRFVEALCAEGIECDSEFYTPLYQSELFQVEARDYPQIEERYGFELERRCHRLSGRGASRLERGRVDPPPVFSRRSDRHGRHRESHSKASTTRRRAARSAQLTSVPSAPTLANGARSSDRDDHR